MTACYHHPTIAASDLCHYCRHPLCGNCRVDDLGCTACRPYYEVREARGELLSQQVITLASPELARRGDPQAPRATRDEEPTGLLATLTRLFKL